MKIKIISREKAFIKKFKKAIKEHGFNPTIKNPDIILTIGGDGTLFYAERLYPEIPNYQSNIKLFVINALPSIFTKFS